MADVKKLEGFIKKWEGGFANDPDDRGGATMCGVTMATYETYCRRMGKGKPTVEDLRGMTEREWGEILKTMYWDRWKADRIVNQSVANILVDWVWASGVWGIKRPQRVLGVKEDGVVGSLTLNAVNARDAKNLFYALKADRIKYVDEICRKNPSQAKFRNGWIRRINDLKWEG